MKTKDEEDSVRIRIAHKESKKVIRKSKELSWKEYGEHLTQLCKDTPRKFYKSVKAMRLRDESFNPTSIINDRNGKPLFNEMEIKRRWEEYFRDLLNPPGTRQTTEFFPKMPEHLEPYILKHEVEQVI